MEFDVVAGCVRYTEEHLLYVKLLQKGIINV
jgi:hypothetical protein